MIQEKRRKKAEKEAKKKKKALAKLAEINAKGGKGK